jgi:hypothetical protein
MADRLPRGLQPGTVLHHPRFYVDAETGELKAKYLVVLALTRGGDVVWRLLTNRHASMRPEQPPCHHGDPYPGFYLGVIDTAHRLGKKSWLDLRGFDDGDGSEVARLLRDGELAVATTLAGELLRAAMICAAGADDTTPAQERAMRDQLAAL